MAEIGGSNVQIHPPKDWAFILGFQSILLTVIFHLIHKHYVSQIKCWAYTCIVKVFFCFYMSSKVQESIIFGSQKMFLSQKK